MGENNFTKWPTIMYGVALVMCGVAYSILVRLLIKHEGGESLLAKAVGEDWKGKASIIIYAIGIALAWVNPSISFVLYAIVSCVWFIPDRRIEKRVVKEE